MFIFSLLFVTFAKRAVPWSVVVLMRGKFFFLTFLKGMTAHLHLNAPNLFHRRHMPRAELFYLVFLFYICADKWAILLILYYLKDVFRNAVLVLMLIFGLALQYLIAPAYFFFLNILDRVDFTAIIVTFFHRRMLELILIFDNLGLHLKRFVFSKVKCSILYLNSLRVTGSRSPLRET